MQHKIQFPQNSISGSGSTDPLPNFRIGSDSRHTIGGVVRKGSRIIHWELVPDLSGAPGAAEMLRRLDGMLPPNDPSVLRLLGDSKEPALITAFTALQAIAPSSGQVKITGGAAKDPEATVLLLA